MRRLVGLVKFRPRDPTHSVKNAAAWGSRMAPSRGSMRNHLWRWVQKVYYCGAPAKSASMTLAARSGIPGGGCVRQREGDRRALVDLAGEPNAASLGFDRVPTECQAETGPDGAAGLARFNLLELVEDPVGPLFGDARPLIADTERNSAVVG